VRELRTAKAGLEEHKLHSETVEKRVAKSVESLQEAAERMEARIEVLERELLEQALRPATDMDASTAGQRLGWVRLRDASVLAASPVQTKQTVVTRVVSLHIQSQPACVCRSPMSAHLLTSSSSSPVDKSAAQLRF
jgi:hypothetical protein